MAKASGRSQPLRGAAWSSAPTLRSMSGRVVQGIEDQVLTLIGSFVAGDDLGGAADHHPLDISPDQYLAMAIGHRDGIIIALVAHQRQRAGPSRALVAGVIGRRRQGQERRLVWGHPLDDRFLMAAQFGCLAFPAAGLEMGIQSLEALKTGDGNQKVPAGVADQALDLAFIVALAGPPEAIGEEIVGLQLAEDPGALAHPVPQDTRHGQRGVVVEDRARNTAEESEGHHMAITEGLADLRRISLEKARIRVRQVHGKEMGLTLDPGDDYLGLAEVHLRVAGIVGQGHEDLAAAKPPLSDVVLDDGIAALEAMLVPEPLEDPSGRVPLFARRRAVLLKNAINYAGEGIEFGTTNRVAAPIARRHRKPQHLGDRLAVKPKYPRRLANAHPLDMAGAANAAIQIH